MKSIFISIALIIIHIFSLSAEAEMVHTIFFENTDHELHVYRSYGNAIMEKGAVVRVQGAGK